MDSHPILDNGHLRLKQCRHGPMLYLVTDRYVGQSLDRYGEFSQGEVDLFRQTVRPGWTVLDVGANIGSHTVFLARTAGPHGVVHALEPQRILFQILCANVALNGLANVHTHHAAAGAQPGTAAMPRTDYGSVGNFGGLSLQPVGGGESVRVITVDSLDLPACHFAKIDVEGMEAEVIAGAEQTIRRHKPVLYVENDRPEKSAALIEQLLALGYRLYQHLPPLFDPRNYFGATENIFGQTVSMNLLALHGSMRQDVRGMMEITGPAGP